MYEFDTDFAPPSMLGLSVLTWATLVLASAILWGEMLALAWRIIG